MNIYQTIAARQSVRAFSDQAVPEATLTRILEAARLAPSANNRQEWRFVVVRDPATRAKLAVAARNQIWIAEAPVLLVCCAETDEHVMTCGQLCYPIDLAIIIDHITLCATAEGLGTCWIGAFYESHVREILGIPAHIRVVELLPIGYPKSTTVKNKNRLPLKQLIQSERWGEAQG